jgi:hypothetical protein
MADAQEYYNFNMSSMTYQTGRLRDEHHVGVTPPVERECQASAFFYLTFIYTGFSH